MLTPQQLKRQSESAYNQWKDQWRAHARFHSRYRMKPLADFENSGIGRAALCIANGASFEKEVDVIRKYQDNVDIIACDKSLGHCLANGITPKFAMLCDANINTKKYLDPWRKELKDTILLANVCANTEWAEAGNWRDRYFFAMIDVLGSEREFKQLSGCPNEIPAGTNVSNAQVVVLTQSDNNGRRNFFGYDKILLIGFDFCWLPGGNYYAFDRDGGGKHNYMRHLYARTIGNDLCYTSTNLGVSAQWLEGYINTFKLPVVQCSKQSVLALKNMGVLEEQMQYAYKKEDAARVREILRRRNDLLQQARGLDSELTKVGREHYYAYVSSL